MNPVRVSAYNPDVSASIKAQYSQVFSRRLPATWLLTYDVLQNPDSIAQIKKFDSNQEIGLFLEITQSSAAANSITYNDIGSWHFAGSVFLSGYTQADRKKFIDTIFTKYKEIFGKYPTSVGSWWTDSFSLGYMKEKYNITANLSCADQFSTDGYQIWGTYWSTPYYPSRYHAGIPAASVENKLDVVVTQWAPRDTLDGYFDSKYSTQDYFTEPKKDISYFKDLLNLYASSHGNKFGQITIGLEGDFSPTVYTGIYASQLDTAITEAGKNQYKFVTMSQFAQWYRQTFPKISPTQTIKGAAAWYNSPYYRLGIKENSLGNEITIFDLRIYSDQVLEPYYTATNPGKYLEINIPSAIDAMGHKTKEWKLPDNSEVVTNEKELIIISEKEVIIPDTLSQRPGINIKKEKNKTVITFTGQPIGNGNGTNISGWTVEAKHFFSQKKFPLLLLTGKGWNNFKKTQYFISQDEREALFTLSLLPSGKVLTPDYECLQCKKNIELVPAMYANERSYIKTFARKPIIKNNTVFKAATREESKTAFLKTKAKYVYLVKQEGYQEKLPFSPGDLGLELVYANANAEIWQIKP